SSTPPGSYADTVIGTSGSISHAATVSITVPTPDFTIIASPSSQSISRGSTATFSITVTGNNGFNSTVNLTASISPMVKRGPMATVPSTVGPFSTSTLSVSTVRNTQMGTYTVTVTATSGTLSHAVSVTVIVTR